MADQTTKPTPVDKIRAFIVESVGEDMGPEMTRQAERLAEKLGLAAATEPTSPAEEPGSVLGGALAYIEHLLGRIERLKAAAPAPEVREVPAGEARPLVDRETGRDGDLVTITGTLRTTGGAGIGILPLAGAYHDWSVNGWRLELSRPVSPLPAQPGAVGTATVRGVKGVRIARPDALPGRLDGRWIVLTRETEVGAHVVYDADVSDFMELLPAPTGAGVTEGGIR